NLTDYLRKNDAGQLPEVGLQIAATQLSHMLLQPDAVQKLTAEPEKYSKVVDMLCRLATQIQTLQKDRDEAVKRSSQVGVKPARGQTITSHKVNLREPVSILSRKTTTCST